jgi:hypothetical protein
MNETVKAYLAAKGHPNQDFENGDLALSTTEKTEVNGEAVGPGQKPGDPSPGFFWRWVSRDAQAVHFSGPRRG